MGTEIRRGDLDADRRLIVDGLARWLTPDSDDRRFDWLYRANPAGPARVWIATDTTTQTPIGIGSAFPRRLWLGGDSVEGWVLGDFCVHPEYRTLGPALQLQRACLSVAEGGLCYDFPSRGMLAVYTRLRIAPRGQLVRLARPLRVDRQVRERLDVPGLTRVLTAAGNLALGLRDAAARADSSVTVEPLAGRCTDAFTRLWRDQAGALGLAIERSADYLNWRYLDSSHTRYEILAARQGGELAGWAVFTQHGEDASLVDCLARDAPPVVAALVKAVVRRLRKRGVATVSAHLWEAHPWLPLMRDLGFLPRESTPVILHAAGAAPQALSEPGPDWFLWQGDRDS